MLLPEDNIEHWMLKFSREGSLIVSELSINESFLLLKIYSDNIKLGFSEVTSLWAYDTLCVIFEKNDDYSEVGK